mmetsp:Transcript_12716/g.30697  ORF Transcript_12716/g.30697 Transcript_12716/m.30697 type:complete len:125 (+) Transcript_12716:113-487(+)
MEANAMLRRVAIICVALIALTIKHVDGSTQVASCEYQGLSGSVRFFRETDGTLSINETEIPSKVLLEAEIGSSLRLHYPTLTQHGCHLYVAYSRFYSKTMEPDDPGGSFNQQGIIVKRVTILPA